MTRLSCTTTVVLVLGGAMLLASLNLMTDPSAALHASTYIVSLTGKYLCFAMLALAVDLVWGFAGILTSRSFRPTSGHGAASPGCRRDATSFRC